MRDDDGVAVSAHQLYFAYDTSKSWVLKGINLDIRAGEHIGLLGPSGAGKTTLCLCLAGAVPHVVNGQLRGDVRIFGRRTVEMRLSEISATVGLLLDDPETQLFNITVEDEVAFGIQNLGLPREEILRRVDEVLDWTGLKSVRYAEVFSLSGGQKQRLALAAVLAMRPRLLILDEPTSMLDPVGTRQVFEVVDKLRKEAGITVLLAEQKVEKVAEFAERVFFIADGSIILEGDPSEVLSQVDELLIHGIEPPQVTMMEYELSGRRKTKLGTTIDDGERFLREYLSRE
ncbi:MAG: ABC transporter ATP-binding protein [Thaumarchaeota archaeon]|nr:MAG: ABC transporter ATP-binding protein [Nitrososphaerota archaeon]TLY14274.1 MAG: ABC transporter ATP-binding protein [Nitrososphaerota archaeon]TMQ01392.1 MAG: ABC transporter ATP-binding protein [Nitrososphaerota archaeon]